MSAVAVIGGGITGLVAAYRIKREGHEITLFEASERVGGVIQTVRSEGFLGECGPNTILETSPLIGELISDLDLKGRLLYSNPEAENRYILRNGKPTLLPSSPPAFFRSELFSAKAKLRLLAEPLIRRAPADAEENLAEFVLRRLGREFLDYAINPFVAGVYAGDPARLSVKEAFPKLHALEQKYGSLIRGQILGARERRKRGTVSKQHAKKISFDDGLEVLTKTLGQKLGDSVRTGTAVSAVEKTESGFRVEAAGEGPGPGAFDAVLLALPAYRLAELRLDGTEEFSLEPLSEIHYPPVASVVLGFRRDQVEDPLDGFGTLNPEVEGRETLGTIFSSSLFPDRAPDGHVVLTSYVGGTRSPDSALAATEELFARTLEDLRSIYGIKGEPVFRRSFVYPKAIPQYDVGYGRYRELMGACEKAIPGIFIAGHSRDGISLGDSIVSGHEVSERIGEFLVDNPAMNRSISSS